MTRIAVIGAGIMGSNHVRVLRTIRDCKISAVVDPDRAKGEVLAAAAGAIYLADPLDAVALADAAVLAVPSGLHAAIGVPLLRAGLALLVEKPIATNLDDALELVEGARAAGRLLMVGHVERFNPAALELRRLVSDPVHLELTRIGPFSPRVSSDVVLDLMIHDIDLACALVRSPVVDVQAIGRSVRTTDLDVASALLRFENGVTAALTASRAGQTKIRHVEITQRETYIVADLIRQDVTIHRVDHNEFLSEGGSRYRQTGLLEIPFLEHRGEPLALELEHFLSCVGSRTTPDVTGEQGLAALELALQIRSLATGVSCV